MPPTPTTDLTPPDSWPDHPRAGSQCQGGKGPMDTHLPAGQLLNTQVGCRVYCLNHAGHRNGAARLGPRSYKVNGYPGLGQGDQAGGGPREARLRRAKISIPSPSHRLPTSSTVSCPRRAEPRCLLLLPTRLVALVQRCSAVTARTTDRVCRQGFKGNFRRPGGRGVGRSL